MAISQITYQGSGLGGFEGDSAGLYMHSHYNIKAVYHQDGTPLCVQEKFYISRRRGSSRICLTSCMYLAPSAPSVTRWSALRVAFMRQPTPSEPSALTMGTCLAEPTAIIAAAG